MNRPLLTLAFVMCGVGGLLAGRTYAASPALDTGILEAPDKPAPAFSNNCTLIGGLRAPADLTVYDEVNGGNGPVLWGPGRIQRDQTISITTSDERMRYDYRYGPSDTWKNVGAWCHNDDRVTVP